MDSALAVGTILLAGFFVAELVERIGLPKFTGYILAGVLINPKLNPLVPASSLGNAGVVTDISLAFITFSVGGSLEWKELRRLGRAIVSITVLEAETAALLVAAAFLVAAPLLVRLPGATFGRTYLPLALIMASLASPTDPSATLAVVHEYRADGPVTRTILGVTALDDVAGILNYSVATAVAKVLVAGTAFSLAGSVGKPTLAVLGALALGLAMGLALSAVAAKILSRETEGALIVLIFALLGVTFGLARQLHLDELLATMAMGAVVANTSSKGPQIFSMLERYTEELVFVAFFTLSGMMLDLAVLAAVWPLTLLFVLSRGLGKYLGTMLGSHLGRAPREVRRYAAGGLIPQGGIVIGLALVAAQEPAFHALAPVVLNVVLGTTIFHELLGPLASKFALQLAGELGKKRAQSA